jgi:hypothetical protein
LLKISEEMAEGNSSNLILSIEIRRNRIQPLGNRPSNLTNTKPKGPKPKIFAEIPRYLVKISSTLFKKATTAEIFLSKLDQRKKQATTVKKASEAKSIIKVGETELEGRNHRQQFINNLMSEQSTVNMPKKNRRKSVEVLMREQTASLPGSGLQSPETMLGQPSSRDNPKEEVKNKKQRTNNSRVQVSYLETW